MKLAKIYSRLKNSSLFLNLFSVGAALVISKTIRLLIIGYPARILGPENFGIIGFGNTLTAFAGMLLLPGITTWGTRNIARDKNNFPETLLVVNITRVILAILTYTLLIIYVFIAVNNPLERTVVLLCGLTLFSSALTIDWVFNGLELMRIPAMMGIFGSVLYVIALFTLIHMPEDIFRYALFASCLSLFTTILSFGFILKRKIQFIIPQFRIFRESITASLPLGIMMSIIIVVHYTSNLIVKYYLGNETLGIFMSAFYLIELSTTIPNMLGSVFLARLARSVVESRELAIRDARIFAQTHMIIAFFVAGILFSEAPSIIAILFGSKYMQSVGLLRIMSVAVIFNYAIYGYTNCLISFGRDRVMLLVVTVAAFVSVGGGMLLVPWLGVVGAAIVIVSIDLSGWIVSLPYYRKSIGSFNFKVWIMPAIGAATMILISLWFQKIGIPFWIRITVFTAFYSLFVYKNIYETFKKYS